MSDRVVSPKGKVSIEHARDLKESLQSAFNESDSVVLDLADVSSIDLTAIHLVYAAKRHADRTQKDFHLAGRIAPEVAEAFVVGGFTKGRVADGEELEENLVDFALNG
jgi:anti-anti-sigma factor